MAKRPKTFQDFVNEINNEDFKLILLRDFRGDVDAARTAYFVEKLMEKQMKKMNELLISINKALYEPEGVIDQIHAKLDILLENGK